MSLSERFGRLTRETLETRSKNELIDLVLALSPWVQRVEGLERKVADLGARLKEIGNDPLYADERAVLDAYGELLDQQTEAKAKRKAAQEDMDKKVDAKYPKLTEAEIKTLVVDDKWMAQIAAAVQDELDRVSQTLTGRIRELAERYATPLPKLTDEVQTLTGRVQEHLTKMGASWK